MGDMVDRQYLPSTSSDESEGSYRFLHRVGRMSLVDQAITTTTSSYQRVKGATPSMIQPAIESVEQTSIRILGRLMSTIEAMPLPLKYADDVACGGLDKVEQLTAYKQRVMERLRMIIGNTNSLTDREFYRRLYEFANETRDLAVGGIRSHVQAFVDTQLRLLERIEDALDSFYRTQKRRIVKGKDSDDDMSDVRLRTDLEFHVRQIRQAVDDVMQQRNIMGWLRGVPNPLEPVWRHLHQSVQALTPDETAMSNFSDKVYFLRVILHSIVEQIKLAAESPRSTLEELKNNMLTLSTELAVAWLPEFALEGITRITGYQLLDQASPQPAPMPPPVERIRTIRSSVYKIDEEDEENVDEPETVFTRTEPKVAESEKPRIRKRVSVVEPPTIIDCDSVLEAVPEVSPEAEDSSDQHSPSGLENSTDLETTDEGEGKKASRSARRRKNKSAKQQDQADDVTKTS